MALLGFQSMVQGSQYYIVTDQRPVTDGDASLILETTAAVDEHVLSQSDVFAAVRIEGWKQAEGPVRRLACELGEDVLDLLRGVVGIVQLRSDPQGLLGVPAGSGHGRRALAHRLPAGEGR